MVRILAGMVAVAFAGAGSTPVAQEDERDVAKEVAPAPASTEPLTLQFELERAGEPGLAGRFARFADVALFLRMRNTGDAPLLVAIDEAARRWIAVPDLLAVELTRADGAPLALPEFQVGMPSLRGFTNEMNWFALPVRSLAAGGSLDWTIPLCDVPGWQSIELAPGAYLVRATYRGPPDLSSLAHADAGAASAWRGAVVTRTLRFVITDAMPALHWSEPHEGLRIAPIPDPRGDRFMVGETIELTTMLENATDAPRVIVREVGSSEDDGLAISVGGGKDLLRGSCISTGINHRVRFTLTARARIRIHAAPVRLDSARIVAGNREYAGAVPGRYTLRQRIEIEDPTPPSRTFLEVPPRELEVVARR